MNELEETAQPLMLLGWTSISKAVGVGRATCRKLAQDGYFGDYLKADPRDGRPIILQDDLIELVNEMPTYKRHSS